MASQWCISTSFPLLNKYNNLTASLNVILNQSKVKFHCLKKVLGQNSAFFLISFFQNLVNRLLFLLETHWLIVFKSGEGVCVGKRYGTAKHKTQHNWGLESETLGSESQLCNHHQVTQCLRFPFSSLVSNLFYCLNIRYCV